MDGLVIDIAVVPDTSLLSRPVFDTSSVPGPSFTSTGNQLVLGIPQLVMLDSIRRDLGNRSIEEPEFDRRSAQTESEYVVDKTRTRKHLLSLADECFTNTLTSVLPLYSSFHPSHTLYLRTLGFVVLYTLAISVSCT